MGPGIGMALGGLGSAIGGLFGMSGQSSANRANIQMAREQMAFQERMSNTALQRSANDAEMAGLNRILALGKPASTPPGQTAKVENENAAAMQAALTMAQIYATRKAGDASAAQAALTNSKKQVIAPAAGVGDTIGKVIDATKKNTATPLYDRVRGAMTDMFEMLDIGGHNKTRDMRDAAKRYSHSVQTSAGRSYETEADLRNRIVEGDPRGYDQWSDGRLANVMYDLEKRLDALEGKTDPHSRNKAKVWQEYLNEIYAERNRRRNNR